MKTSMEKDVVDLGKRGVLRDVALGYARNHLILRGLDIEATPQKMKELERITESRGEHYKQQKKLTCQKIEKPGQFREASPRRRSLKEKTLTAALVGGLLTGSAGCNVGQNNQNQDRTEPITPDPIEETLDIDREEIESIEIPTQEVLSEERDVFELPIRAENRLHLNVDSNIREYIDSVHVVEGEVVQYPVFDTKEGQEEKQKERINDFVNSLVDGEILGENPLYISSEYTEWDLLEGKIGLSYSGHFLTLYSEKPLDIPGVQINPESKESIEEGLKKITSKIVDGGFEHKIDQIVKEGDDYRVHYRRLLNGIPVYTIDYQPYLILSSEGKLKESSIWLREFEQIGEVQLLSGDEFNKNINTPDYPKTFLYVPASAGVENLNCDYVRFHGEIGAMRFHDLSTIYREGKDGGVVDLTDVELVYYYRFLQGENEKPPLPMFLLEGKGHVNIPEQAAENLGKDREEILAKVLANAISFDNIKGIQ